MTCRSYYLPSGNVPMYKASKYYIFSSVNSKSTHSDGFLVIPEKKFLN